MGNNAAFTSFEASVIAVYNSGALDKELLTKLIKVYADTDIDTGGKVGTLSKDGLEIEEIVIKVMGGKLPVKPDLPKNYRKWTPQQEQQNEDYNEAVSEKFFAITGRLGW